MGLQITLVGVLVVFATFALLVFLMHWARSALSGTGFVLRRKLAMPGPVPPNLVPGEADVLVAPVVTGGSAGDPGVKGVVDDDDNDDDGGISLEKAAAISAVLCEVMSGAAYEVMSVRRVEGGGAASGSAWSLAGRMDVMRSREMLSRRKG